MRNNMANTRKGLPNRKRPYAAISTDSSAGDTSPFKVSLNYYEDEVVPELSSTAAIVSNLGGASAENNFATVATTASNIPANAISTSTVSTPVTTLEYEFSLADFKYNHQSGNIEFLAMDKRSLQIKFRATNTKKRDYNDVVRLDASTPVSLYESLQQTFGLSYCSGVVCATDYFSDKKPISMALEVVTLQPNLSLLGVSKKRQYFRVKPDQRYRLIITSDFDIPNHRIGMKMYDSLMPALAYTYRKNKFFDTAILSATIKKNGVIIKTYSNGKEVDLVNDTAAELPDHSSIFSAAYLQSQHTGFAVTFSPTASSATTVNSTSSAVTFSPTASSAATVNSTSSAVTFSPTASSAATVNSMSSTVAFSPTASSAATVNSTSLLSTSPGLTFLPSLLSLPLIPQSVPGLQSPYPRIPGVNN